MKKLWLLTILGLFQLFFSPELAQAQTKIDKTIVFGVEKTTLKNAFQELERLSGLSVSYNNTRLNDQQVLTIKKGERTVKQVLQLLLEGTAFTYKMGSGNTILIVNKAVKGKISGTVVDENNEPLPAAVVRIPSLGLARQTKNDGTYTLDVPPGQYTVEVTFISYEKFVKTQVEVKGNATTTMGAKLTPSSNALSEVVVTALGIKREERALGYAITQVDSTALTNAVSTNWTDALSGKVAGLNLVRNGGLAGSNKIILRGENNLTGDNEALIVIDGVVSQNSKSRIAAPTSGPYATSGDNLPADFGSGLNDLNPDDIESVTVLKGPGATALYGQRGANGAVIITTKSGSAKKKLGITFSSNLSWEEINRGPNTQYEFGQGQFGVAHFSYGASADGNNQNSTSSSWGAPFDGQMFFQYDPATKKAGTVRTPWVAYENPLNSFFETGVESNHSLSVEGTYKNVAMRFSGSHGNNNWIVPNTGLQRSSATFTANAKVTKKLDINVKAMYNNRNSDNLPATGYGNQSLMYWFMFAQPNVDVNWYRDYWAPGEEYRKFVNITTTNPESPYAISEQYLNTQKRNGILGNVQAIYKFSKTFSAMVRGSIDYAEDNRTQKRPWDAAGSKFAQGSFRVQEINMREINGDFMLTYNQKIKKDFDLTVRAGASSFRNTYYKDEQRADGLVVPNDYSLANAANPIIFVPDTTRYQINSVYALASLTYKNYLYLDLTARADWNSTLATPSRSDNVGFNYPSASLSFIASDYFKLPKEVISFAKLRLSAAQVGSGGTVPYRTAYNYALAANNIYPDSASTNPSILPNVNLKPLKTTTYEVGAEVQFFNGRLGFDIAAYAGNTKNQILTRQLDRSSGYNFAIINAGRVDNSGLEIALNAKPISAKEGFNWAVNMTFSTNKNEIKELSDSSLVLRTGALGGGQVVANVGGSMGDVYGIGYLKSPDGQIVYDATSGFAKFTSGVVPLGNTIPKYRASINNTFSYKGFSVSALFDAQFGAVAHSLTFSRMAALGKLKETLPGRYNGIIGKGVIQNTDGTYRPNDVIATDIQNYYNSIYGSDQAEGSIFSTDFVKFREASIGYTFSNSLVKKMGLSRLSLSAYGRNLFIWSPWPAFDPEFGTLSGTDIVTGFETGQLPSTRTFGLRLVAGFGL